MRVTSRVSTVTRMSSTARTLDDCRTDAARLLRKYARAESESRTPILRELAEVLVDARTHFLRDDGTPDIKGRTYAYREFVREVYSGANIPPELASSVQAAVRYHVSNVLRTRLSEDELADEGLIPQNARERSQGRRATRSALIAAVSGGLPGSALLGLTAASGVLKHVDAAELAQLDEREREVAAATLKDVARRVRALLRQLDAD